MWKSKEDEGLTGDQQGAAGAALHGAQRNQQIQPGR